MNGKEEKTEKAFSLIGCAMKNIMDNNYGPDKFFLLWTKLGKPRTYVQTLNKHAKVLSNEVQQMNGKAIKKTEHFFTARQ